MKEIIHKFRQKVTEVGERNLFNAPASIEEIQAFEKTMNISLPEEIRSFFLTFNGGCIIPTDLNFSHATKSIHWNSNYFLTLSEIIDSYNFNGDFANMDLEFQEELSGKRLIPLLHTKGQELLIWDATNPDRTPILDAWHEINANEWTVLFDSFENLLEQYIDKEGDINTIG